MKGQFFIGHISALVLGGLIYIFFRSSSLKMFAWFDYIGLTNAINKARNLTLSFRNDIPDWVIFSLPDGLWIFSYVSLILLIWNNNLSRANIFWIIIVPLVAIFSELAQYFNPIFGTFDFVDLLFYILGFQLPFFLFPVSINLKYSNHV